MRGVVVVALVSLAYALLCEGFGSGDFIVITPTSKASPPTDATNDSGSGDDDEDYSNGSGSKPTRVSTVGPTTDDEGSGASGSGGYNVATTNMPKTVDSTMATTNTDIYIMESTTEKVNTVPITDDKTTQITDSMDPSTPSPTVVIANVVTTESPTQATEEKTTPAIVRKTAQVRETTVRTTSEGPKTTVELKTEGAPTDVTTQQAEEKQTTNDVNAFALKKDEEEEGFTLTTEVIAGVVGCALLALLLIAFLMYRLKKRDEGSYLLDDQYDKKMGNSDKEAFV